MKAMPHIGGHGLSHGSNPSGEYARSIGTALCGAAVWLGVENVLLGSRTFRGRLCPLVSRAGGHSMLAHKRRAWYREEREPFLLSRGGMQREG